MRKGVINTTRPAHFSHSEHPSGPAGWCAKPEPKGKAVDYDVSRMDDFQVIAERQRVMETLATLTDQYRALNNEIQRRETLQWMVAR